MRTDALIQALSHDLTPVRAAATKVRFALAMLASLALAAFVAPILFGWRDNLPSALGMAGAKALYCLVIAVAITPLAYALSRPNVRVRRLVGPVALAGLASLVVAALAFAAMPAETRLASWLDGGFPECLRCIPILAVPVAVVLTFVARSMAPTRLTLAGAALGGLSGAIAAIGYSAVCSNDSVAYVATWYLVAISGCAAFGAGLGRWVLRW